MENIEPCHFCGSPCYLASGVLEIYFVTCTNNLCGAESPIASSATKALAAHNRLAEERKFDGDTIEKLNSELMGLMNNE